MGPQRHRPSLYPWGAGDYNLDLRGAQRREGVRKMFGKGAKFNVLPTLWILKTSKHTEAMIPLSTTTQDQKPPKQGSPTAETSQMCPPFDWCHPVRGIAPHNSKCFSRLIEPLNGSCYGCCGCRGVLDGVLSSEGSRGSILLPWCHDKLGIA